MLTNLHVKNLALIEEAEVAFGPGLNILTGETGAGKSILIGSINLALGRKMTREMIREGASSCLVELVFQIENPQLHKAVSSLSTEKKILLTLRYQCQKTQQEVSKIMHIRQQAVSKSERGILKEIKKFFK